MARGCGKTTLARNLEKFNPEKYCRTIETTTRAMRDFEKQDDDYHFISPEEYEHVKRNMFERVEKQFFPDKYGAFIHDLKEKKWNLVVASIEGFFSGCLYFNKEVDNQILVNIILDDETDVERDGRNSFLEERNNQGALYPFYFNDTFGSGSGLYIAGAFVQYYEIKLSDLKKDDNRNNPEWLLKTFDDIVANARIPY